MRETGAVAEVGGAALRTIAVEAFSAKEDPDSLATGSYGYSLQSINDNELAEPDVQMDC